MQLERLSPTWHLDLNGHTGDDIAGHHPDSRSNWGIIEALCEGRTQSMKWNPTGKSAKMRDSRGGRGGSTGKAVGGAGGAGLIGLILYLLFGIGGGDFSASTVPSLDSGGSTYNQPANVSDFVNCEDLATEIDQFVCVIASDNAEYWNQTFADFGLQYNDAQFQLYDQPIRTGCGSATAAIGPHYCPLDNGVYLELGFFDQLATQFGASGDAAWAYVIGHEYAHHVQNEIGISTEVRELQSRYPNERNGLSVKLELQADCLAGVWMGSLAQRSNSIDFEDDNEVREALNAAAAVGDDRIQEATAGYTDPHTWTHGSSQQRYDWFLTGYQTVDTEFCDTFA